MWQTEMLEILRVLINDMDETPKYEDERLHRILMVAAFQVAQSLDFVNDYTIDIQGSTLTPDPTSTDFKEDSFVNLTCIKAACIIERGQTVLSANQAIVAKEFHSSVDLSKVAESKQKLLEKGGWCSLYEQESLEHQANSASATGAAILGPFRTLAGYPGYPVGNY